VSSSASGAPGSSPLAKLARLTWPDRWRLLEAAGVLSGMSLLVSTLGVQRAHALVERLAVAPTHPDQESRAGEFASVVDRAARHVPWAHTCLHRSLTLWWLLRRRGIPADVRLGVRKADGRFDAHAWVTCGGRVVNDEADVELRYQPLAWMSGPTPR
jgi:hypothetical protein